MKTLTSLSLAIITVAIVSTISLPASAANAFYLTSSDLSATGEGRTVYGTPSDYYLGFFETAGRWSINARIVGITTADSWEIDICSPTLLALTPGTYQNAERYGFTAAGRPGLNFHGNGRGNNTLTGSFTIQEISFLPNLNKIDKLALDLVQYDNGNTASWNRISFRFNSNIPINGIPEPGVSSLALLAGSLMFRRKK